MTGMLQAGQYRLEATSLGRNDRLVYTVGLTSEALQPGVARQVTLPATVHFAVAEARVVSLTSFGNTPLKGVLRREDGGVVARIGARADDWNIAASRLLPAGAYKLDLAAASPPDLSKVSQPSAPVAADASSDNSSSDDDSDKKPVDDQEAQSAPAAPSNDDSSPVADSDAPSPSTALRLALPAPLPVVAAPAAVAELTGAGVHVLSLAQPKPGQLVVAQAASSASLVGGAGAAARQRVADRRSGRGHGAGGGEPDGCGRSGVAGGGLDRGWRGGTDPRGGAGVGCAGAGGRVGEFGGG